MCIYTTISTYCYTIFCEIYVLILSRFFFFFSTTTFIYECLHPKRKGGNEGRIEEDKTNK
ncbi:hypothetical protein PFMC_02437 [Plasmodium falciparum CAMP/Malaysia]|uniref:Uncharacterized protein n=1 Tax=Plasmodium falciparum (isolate Camp / Malaysia) TaxID=5835 RepID=A0A024X833_PLAFC|nr:hypothetical protein PFMC_02437 [Plasmodium falciparum CAMP/Malaysia]